MDYEKKYKEALSKAKDMLSYKEVRREDMEYLFPELKDSDDEKIRKEIISFLKEGKPYYCPNSVRRQEWANWLLKKAIVPSRITIPMDLAVKLYKQNILK